MVVSLLDSLSVLSPCRPARRCAGGQTEETDLESGDTIPPSVWVMLNEGIRFGVIAAKMHIISDPRRGCYIVLPVLIFFSFFFPPLLSGPYLWNRYSQRLQIECAAWSCCLILHYSLPSNSLRYFFFLLFFLFFRHDFVGAISLEPSLVETPDWVCCLVLLFNFALLLTIQFASLFFFFFFFFSATILSGPYLWNHYLQRLQIECAAWSCGLILHCCLPSNSFRYFLVF